MANKIDFKVRAAKVHETDEILFLIKQLADYERLSDQVSASSDMIKKYGFGKNKYFQTLLVENRKNNSPRFLGFALYFYTFSTFLGKPSLYLEDLFVLPNFRGYGIGKALLKELAKIALKSECGRMEWAVLNWNEPAIKFYQDLGAFPMDDWTVYRLTIPEIKDMAR